MKSIEEYIQELKLLNNIEIKDIPEIDLYMDQVIQLFESKLDSFKRNDEDKIMTKTMINNYVKGKLLMPVNKKKYSKEHIMLINMIYQLKGGLSISDIKEILESIADNIEKNDNVSIEDTYKNYIEINIENSKDFEDEIRKIDSIMKEKIKGNEENSELLIVTTLINKSNMYRRLAEKIIDDGKESKIKK